MKKCEEKKKEIVRAMPTRSADNSQRISDGIVERGVDRHNTI